MSSADVTPLRRTERNGMLGGKENRGYGSSAVYKNDADRIRKWIISEKLDDFRYQSESRPSAVLFPSGDTACSHPQQVLFEKELLKMAITKLGLSARAYDRILKVARTIADLSASSSIRSEYISEAPPAAGRDSVSKPGSEPVEWVNGDVLY